METARILGNNITLLLKQKGVTKEAFASELGYSIFDVQKLCDARIFTDKNDMEDIAKYFNVNKEYLITDKGIEAYEGEGFMCCMAQFKKPENKEKILDIFDMYCDMREALKI